MEVHSTYSVMYGGQNRNGCGKLGRQGDKAEIPDETAGVEGLQNKGKCRISKKGKSRVFVCLSLLLFPSL